MKRKVIATLLGSCLLSAAQSLPAKECTQVGTGDAVECREIAHADLGPPFCLVPEGFNIRAVSQGGPTDPWVTTHPIALGNVPLGVSHSAAACRHQADLTAAQLEISKTAAGYHVKTTGSHKVDMDATVTEQNGNGLWLSAVDPNRQTMHYFIFFRDKSRDDNLPKFLLIEALDSADGNCMANAPAVGTTVLDGQCHAPTKVEKGDGLPFEKESGVGGGGERH